MIRAFSVFLFIFTFLIFVQLLWKVMTKQEKWEFTKTSPSAPFVGRTKPPAPIIDIYYVTDGYVVDDYVEVQQGPAY